MLKSVLPVTALVMSILVGCATTPSREEFAAAIDVGRYVTISTSISLGEVSGDAKADLWSYTPFDVVEFRGALLDALKASGLFEEVFETPSGAYQLSAEIVTQEITGKFDNTITLLVHYEVMRAEDGSVVWSDNLFSEGELSVSDVFAGMERIKRLQREAVADNFQQLLEALDRELRS